MTSTITLFRPVGLKELELIQASEFRAFPPRLEHQPIFYPVTTYVYAERIARDWNTTDAASQYAGFVTRFAIRAEYLARHPIRTVGGQQCQEYWIAAEELPEFNRNLVGLIEVVASFRGKPPDGKMNP